MMRVSPESRPSKGSAALALLLVLAMLVVAYSPLVRAFFDPQEFFTILVPRAADWSVGRTIAEGWTYLEEGGSVGGFFRPLPSIMYILEYELFGADTAPWMIVSILVHAACCLSVGWLAMKMGMPWTISVLAMLLLAAHPRAVTAVRMVNTRPDILATMFAVLAAGFTVRARSLGAGNLAVIFLLAFAAMASKELGFAAVPLVLLVYFALPRERSAREAISLAVVLGAALLITLALRSAVLDYVGGYRAYNTPLQAVSNAYNLFTRVTGVMWIGPRALRLAATTAAAALLSVPFLLRRNGWRRLLLLAGGTLLLGIQVVINHGPLHYEYGACAFFALFAAACVHEVLRGRRTGDRVLIVIFAAALIPLALLGRRMNAEYAARTDMQRDLFEAVRGSLSGIDPSSPWAIEMDAERTGKMIPYYVWFLLGSEEPEFSFIPPGTRPDPGTGLISYDGSVLTVLPPDR